MTLRTRVADDFKIIDQVSLTPFPETKRDLELPLLQALLRNFYPLKSGLGTIANSRLFKNVDGNPPGDVVVKAGYFRLMVPQDDFVGRSIKYFGDLDKKISWVVGNALKPGDTALDIGANLGVVSFRMLERIGSSGKVIAFEPQSRMCRYIEQSIALNNIMNLHLYRMGVGDRIDRLRLSIPDHRNAGAASFAATVGAHFEEVPVTTLDDFSREHDLANVRLIKIDVEGYEPQVFTGGKGFLTTVKPDVIVFEENRQTDDIPASIEIIQSLGYDVFALPKAWFSVRLTPYRKEKKAHDFVAIHREASDDLRRRLGI